MACKSYECFKSCMYRFKLYRVAVLVVFAIVVFPLGVQSHLNPVEQVVSFETKSVALPLPIANDYIPQSVATADVVDRMPLTLSRISETKILTPKHLSLQRLGHLNAQTTLRPYFDRHVIGMQVKITF